MEQKHETFHYTYSAGEQEEINRIRQKYAPREEDKMEQLRRLDAGVARKGTVTALAIGILSALVLGVGMCCCLVWAERLFVPGIIIGVAGIIGVSLAYPAYQRVTARERKKIAPLIISLTDELLK